MIYAWLQNIGLEDYTGILLENGFEEISDLPLITIDDLKTMNFKLGHSRRLLAKIKSMSAGPVPVSVPITNTASSIATTQQLPDQLTSLEEGTSGYMDITREEDSLNLQANMQHMHLGSGSNSNNTWSNLGQAQQQPLQQQQAQHQHQAYGQPTSSSSSAATQGFPPSSSFFSGGSTSLFAAPNTNSTTASSGYESNSSFPPLGLSNNNPIPDASASSSQGSQGGHQSHSPIPPAPAPENKSSLPQSLGQPGSTGDMNKIGQPSQRSASNSSRNVGGGDVSVDSNSIHNPTNPNNNSVLNDWMCLNCNALNSNSQKRACFKCGTKKPDNGRCRDFDKGRFFSLFSFPFPFPSCTPVFSLL